MQFVTPLRRNAFEQEFQADCKADSQAYNCAGFSLKAEGSNRQMSPVQTQKFKHEQTEAETESEPQCRDQYALRDQYNQ